MGSGHICSIHKANEMYLAANQSPQRGNVLAKYQQNPTRECTLIKDVDKCNKIE